MNAEKIHIADLHQPILTQLQTDTLNAAAAHSVTMTEEAILHAAKEATGLDDFGAQDFRVRLRKWVDAINASTDLVELARAGLYADMVRFASNRLRVEDCVKRVPAILDIIIDRPLIVAGLPRSGTTYLQNFLAADPQLRSLPYWEALQPVPAPDESTAEVLRDPRYARAQAVWEQGDALLPYIKAVHPFEPDHISEDIELQAIDFSSYFLEWLVPHPIWADYYWNTDQASSYRYLKKVMQVLTWIRGPNRWLMKCPQHMEQLPALMSVFPDATVILTHRDPVASIQSAITSVAYSARIRNKTVDADGIARYWIKRYENLLGRCVRDRDILPESRSQDVYFHELIDDPMRVIEQIYRKAGLRLDDALRATMAQFMKDNQRGKYGSIDHDLRRDFGRDPAEIRSHFDFYLRRFPVKVEVR
jgi:hypothetical protein